MLPSSLPHATGNPAIIPNNELPAARAARLPRGFEDVEIKSELTLQAQLHIARYLLSKLGADGLADLLRVPRACVAHPFAPEALHEVVRLDIVADGCGRARLLAIDAGSSIAAQDLVAQDLTAHDPAVQDLTAWDGALLGLLAGLLRDKLAAAPVRRLVVLDPTPGADGGSAGGVRGALAPLLPGLEVAAAAAEHARDGDLVFRLSRYRPAQARLFETLHDAGAAVFSPLACELMSSRAWPSLLHHECLQELLTPRQREAIVEFVPRTFRLNDMNAFVLFEERDGYVFKRIDGHGARGTMAGHRATTRVLDAMRRSPKDWIAQKRVDPAVPDMIAHIAPSRPDTTLLLYRVGGRYGGGWRAPDPRGSSPRRHRCG